MKATVTMSPLYRRGSAVIQEVGLYARQYAQKVYIAGGNKALNVLGEQLVEGLRVAGVTIMGTSWYGGECTKKNIETLAKSCQESGAQLLIAVGGGKALDVGKAAANQAKIPCITIPTIAATCAAITPLSIVHTPEGVYVENLYFDQCPIGVFVDTDIIAKAPRRWLAAGMGDTLAKWYELRATTSRIPSTSWTIGAITNGKICYDLIRKFGPEARRSADLGLSSEAMEYVIDAIIFFAASSSILGGEKCRGAASHSVYFGFTNIPAAHKLGHGLLVGFGNLCLLALEDREDDEIQREIQLATACGVPTTLAEIAELSETDLGTIGHVAANALDMKNMPFEVTPEMVIQSMKRVDSLARNRAAQ